VEGMFRPGTLFSGYDEFNIVPDTNIIIWFYVITPNTEHELIEDVIRDYQQRLSFVISKTDSSQTKILLTLSKRIVHNNFVDSDQTIIYSIEDYNKSLMSLSNAHPNIYVFNIDEFLTDLSLYDIIDWKFYYMAKMYFAPKHNISFRKWFDGKMNTINYVRKKCLVLDLDNTLWGGVLGEEGIGGVKLGGDYPGNAFKDFQQNIKESINKGVIVAICSKNNENDVKEMISRHPEMVLNEKDFLLIKSNWTDKAQNIVDIANELNIGLDSFVFIDDNPRERERVKSELPMIEVPEFPSEPYMLYDFFKMVYSQYFQIYKLTTEDKRKKDQYFENFKREKLKVTLSSMDDYISALDIELSFFKNMNLSRVSQMTQKTNQFNLTTRRYTESDLNRFVEQSDEVYSIGVKDKFGDSGITGAAIITIDKANQVATIDSFLVSCRILGRGIENVFLNLVLNSLYMQGLRNINACYLKTKKNEQTVNFYENNGFTIEEKTENSKSYKLTVNGVIEINKSYRIIKI